MEKTITTEDGFAQKIGFTAERFRNQSFLRQDGDRIVMSYILPRGPFGRPELAEEIRRAGFVPATLDLGTGKIEDFAELK